MTHGREGEADLRTILENALSLHSSGAADNVVHSALLRLAYEQTLFVEYLLSDRCREFPLTDPIIEGIGVGIAERARSVAALVETQMDVMWREPKAKAEAALSARTRRSRQPRRKAGGAV
jgi:hypothetical protein